MTTLTDWSTTSNVSQFEAQTGIWTNWSRGRVLGATLTLSRQNGNLLIAFTAFYIGLVSTRFWRIACFIMHRQHSSPQMKDAFHHQQQAILRNSPNPESGLWAFGQLLWAWRRSAKHSLIRALPGLVCALVCLVGFTVAGGFSSRISTGISNEVLVKSDSCSQTPITALDPADFGPTIKVVSQTITGAANYAQQCYASSDLDILDCASGHFVVSRMPTTIDVKAPCPFASGVCRDSNSNLRLDSGYLDSNDHFGINAPPNQRFLFRQSMECAPLNTDAFKSETTINDDSTGLSLNYTRYNYGPTFAAVEKDYLNYTCQMKDVLLQYNDQGSLAGNMYKLQLVPSTPHPCIHDYESEAHVPSFQPHDGTVFQWLRG